MLKVNLFAELERIGLPFEYSGDENWLKVLCPFHDDTTPSCFINTAEQFFTCKACNAGGDFAKLVARHLKVQKYQVVALWDTLYGQLARDKPVENDTIERFHAAIWQALPLLKELHDRGITDDLIRKYRWGEDRGRITIPVPNENGIWVNVIRYSPGAPEKKFTNMSGRGNPARLYPIEQLRYDNLLICGGMTKAVAAAAELNQYGIGAISCTGGEQSKNWPPHLDRQLADKKWLGISLDIDETGKVAAQELAARFARYPDFITVITLPLDRDKYPKGDISDWIGQEHRPLKPLIDAATRWEPKDLEEIQLERSQPVPVSIQQASSASFANKRLEFKALVSAIDDEAYYLPKKVQVICDRKQPLCGGCPIYTLPELPELTISPENEQMLVMLNNARTAQTTAVRRCLRIPACKSVRFNTQEYYHVTQAVLTQDLDTFTADEPARVSAVSIDSDLKLNETYTVTGRIIPHPQTQRATALISKRSEVVDTLANYQVNPSQLEVFQVAEHSPAGIADKLNDIYGELERRVTEIYSRRVIHLLTDLAYHSCLWFKTAPEDDKQWKGWLEVAIFGDPSCGKSLTVERLMGHYGLGRRVNCELATVAGLIGGVSEIARRKYISWGIIPANDRRLVMLDELKGAHPEIVAKLTDMRSTGVADIPKIERGKAKARTRLIVLSNSRSGLFLDSFSYGLEIIREVVPNPEDVRRFDAFATVATSEVSSDIMQSKQAPIPFGSIPKYDSIACRNLVLYAWTRQVHQVHFESWQHVLDATKSLCDQFTDTVPILDRGGSRFKVARLAIALACRLFSHAPNDPQTVYVRNCHVDYIAGFLRHLYTAKFFGYDRFSRAIEQQNRLIDPETVVRKLASLPFPKQFAEALLRTSLLDLQDICDWLYWDKVQGAELISVLVRHQCIVRDGRPYRKTPQFITLVTSLLAESKLNDLSTVPEYIKGQI